MATVYYRPATGAIERIDRDAAATARYGPADPALSRIDFDEIANAETLEDLLRARAAFGAAEGVLTRDGRPVAIAPESLESRVIGLAPARDQVEASIAAALAAIDAAATVEDLKPMLRSLPGALAGLNRRLLAGGL